MANIKSQIKRNRTNEKARLRNVAVRSEVKSAIRKVREQIEAGNAEEAQVAFAAATRKLDKAVSKGRRTLSKQKCDPVKTGPHFCLC